MVGSALLVYRLVAIGYETTGFAEYAVARRTLTLLLPFGVLGLDVALARLVAYAADPRPESARSYIVAAVPISAVGIALTSATILAVPQLFAQLFFGSAEHVSLAVTLPLLLAGATSHVLVYGYLRGRSQILGANLLMVVNHAVLPLVTILAGGPLIRVLAALGLGWLACSGIAFMLADKATHRVPQLSRELFAFGIRRVPGDLFQLAFFALPVIVTAQVGGLADAGIVAFGITALGMIGSSLTPIGFVLLPLASRLMGRGSFADLRLHVRDVLRVAAPLIVLGVVVLEAFAEEIITRYLGPDFAPASGTLRLILLGAIPWSAYILLRSIVDARHEGAVNARNLGVAFLSFILVALAAMSALNVTMSFLVGFVAGLFVIGGLTIAESYRALRSQDPIVEETEVSIETG